MVIATNSVRSLSPLLRGEGWGEGHTRGFEPLTLTLSAALPPPKGRGNRPSQPRGHRLTTLGILRQRRNNGSDPESGIWFETPSKSRSAKSSHQATIKSNYRKDIAEIIRIMSTR